MLTAGIICLIIGIITFIQAWKFRYDAKKSLESSSNQLQHSKSLCNLADSFLIQSNDKSQKTIETFNAINLILLEIQKINSDLISKKQEIAIIAEKAKGLIDINQSVLDETRNDLNESVSLLVNADNKLQKAEALYLKTADLADATEDNYARTIKLLDNAPLKLRSRKCAILLSGHMRTFSKCHESFMNMIARPLQADIFISTWATCGMSMLKDANRRIKESPIDESSLRIYENIKAINIEQEQELKPNFLRKHKINTYTQKPNEQYQAYINAGFRYIVPRLYSMWYKINDVNKLRKEYESKNGFQYDIVIRCRPDLLFKNKIHQEIWDISENKLYIARSECHAGWNDQFAFGNSLIMDVYAEMYNYLDQYISENLDIGIWAEGLMERHFQGKFGINTSKTNIIYEIGK